MRFKFPPWYVTIAEKMLPRWVALSSLMAIIWWLITGTVENPAYWFTMVVGGILVSMWGIVFFVAFFYPSPPEERGMWD